MSNLFKSKFVLGLMLVAAVVFSTGTAEAAITKTLKYGMKDAQVKELQQNLNAAGFTVSTSGAGSVGYETTSFGTKTKLAVQAYQTSKGLTADGVFGPASRAAWTGGSTVGLPAGCTSTSGFSPISGVPCSSGGSTLPAGCTSTVGFSSTTGQPCNGSTTTPVGGAFNVGLSSDTPASNTIPDAANANFTKFWISAGTTPVSITSLYVTRAGLSVNSDLENIKILDANGVQVGSVGSLNTNNKAQITFSPALTVPAGSTQSFFIRAGFVNNTAGGKTAQFGISAASDVVANATAGGSFPFFGNTMGVVALDVGTLTVDEYSTVSNSQPDGGDTDVVVNSFKLTAGSTEAVTVKQIAVERTGTASASDTANIELYDVATGTVVSTVSAWDANGLATFNNLNIVLDKGQTKNYEVRLDIIGGSSLTVNADLTDGSDVRVQAVGNTYGFYITPTNSMTNGQGAADQVIQGGTLTVSKSASTPATGNIASGSDVNLAVFDFDVKGESMKITSLEVNMDLTTMVYGEVTNVKLVNSDTGALLAGPKDLASDSSVVFTDVIILPVGVTKVKVTANIASSVSANDSLNVDIDNASSEIVAKGMTSNDAVTPSPSSAVSGNNLTVQGATLSAVTLATPAARSVVKGAQDFVWATASLSAANSGEDVLVTSVIVESTANVAADDTNSGSEDVDNVEIWADLTAASSARGDVYETKVSNDTKQFTGTNDGDSTLTFTLNPSITVAKNTTVVLAVVADLSSSAVTSDTFAISLDEAAGAVVASGKTTGSSISVTPTGAGQAMTVSAGGTLTVSVDSSSPSAALLLDNTSTEQTTAVFRLAANNTENLNVDSIKITDDGTNGNDVVSVYKFYNGATLLGTVVPDGSGNAELFLTSDSTCDVTLGQLCIPANDYKLVTVKAILNNIDGTGFTNGDTLKVTIDAAGDVDTTGVASGSAVDSTQTSVDAATHTTYETYPTFAFNNTGVTTVLGASGNYVAGKVVITNTGDKDITFDSDDQIKINFEISGTLTSATNAVTLRDSDGTQLDQVNMGATSGSTSATIVFADNTLTIPAGGSETVTIEVNTGGLTTDGNTLQAWLSDDADANAEYSINAGTADYTVGTFVFKSDIYGPTHINP